MSLQDALYRERPNSVLALPITVALTFALYESGEPWTLGVWLFLGFFWILAALCLWSDIVGG